MKIAFIVPSLIQEGVVTVAFDLVKVMNKHGHYCEVFYFDEKKPSFNFSCKTTRINFSDTIDFNYYDVIHSHGLRPDMYVAKHKNKGMSALCVSTSHNFMFADLISDHGYIKGICGGIIWLLVWSKLDRIVVLTNTAKKYYRNFVNSRKISVVYNSRAINHDLEIEESDKLIFHNIINNGKAILGSVCRITDRKGLEDVINVLPLLDDFIYVVIGDGPAVPKLKNLALQLGVIHKVVFMGNRKNGNRYIPYFDVVCMPSRSEGFPLVLLESAAYKKSVVTSDIPIFKEVFNESEIVSCNTKNREIMANSIKLAYREKIKRGNKMYEKYKACYSPEIFYKNYIDIYTQKK